MNSTIELQNLFDDGRYELMNGNFEKGIEYFSELLRQDPDNKLALISRGSAFLKVNSIGEAVKDFDRAIGIDPNYARAYHLRGIAREKEGDNQSALDDFSKAIEFDPEYGAAYYSRATLLTKMKKEDEAIEDIQMVQHLTSKNIETFANENNVWRSQQLKLESVLESELER
ncbi:MAG: tetratricopeptide repeat protein [Desulfobacterales bacterium]|jgi:tetratricopeptide (TPR) repeat protein